VRLLSLLLPALLAAGAGCNQGGHTGPVEDRDTRLLLLNFTLLEGQTTRDHVREEWGTPYSAYEDDRIWTYAFVRGSKGLLVPSVPKHLRGPEFATWEDETYHLILIFEAGILKRHHLLRIS
jgi:hypothetical protein